MKNKIFVNGTILNESPTGLGVYAKNVINKLKNITEIKVIAPIHIEGVEVIKTTKYVEPTYKKKGGIVRFLYTQFIMPFKVEKGGLLYHPFQYLCVLSGRKQIITIHDFIPMYYKEVAYHQYIYYKYFMPLLLKKAYKIVCISNNTKDDLLKFYKVDKSKVHVVYNGYDGDLFNKKNIKDDILKKYNIDYKYMVMIGGGYSHKNLHRAIEAFSYIDDRKGMKLVIVGKTSAYMEEVKSLAKKLNLDKDVIFLGYVPDGDLPTIYGKSQGLIYPSLYEGFGLTILEAWACDTLVLCSNNSSLKEVARDGAITFDPENVEEIKKSIEVVINDEKTEEIEKLKLRSKELLKDFSWDKTAKEIHEVMNH
ncbi:MAG: glycosyltransferase family 1 protein [Clostridium sp.]|uniref:glycosyltransferase family 4 protein n=1 Tax=Clostridium sp. TaxID=1506 RepID=UPI0032171B1F